MVPQYFKGAMWSLDTDTGRELVDVDLITPRRGMTQLSSEELHAIFGDYIEGDEIYSVEIERGWFARLSAPGYMDRTDWGGPYKTKREAKDYIEEMYDVDPDTGEELED